MKKYIFSLTAILTVFAAVSFNSCKYRSDFFTTLSDSYETQSNTVFETETTAEAEPTETAPETVSEPVFENTDATEETQTQPVSTSVHTTSAQAHSSEQPSSAPTEPHSTVVSNETPSIDLSIHVPEANGTMQVDTSPNNKFTKTVHDERGINVNFLAAVFSVPESGQNYVFEFNSATVRTADSIRRVYLIDENGEITGVAAKKAEEKENISSTENWFCMNVLIKKLIFPAIEKEFNS